MSDMHESLRVGVHPDPPSEADCRKVALIVCGYYAHDRDAAVETLMMLGLLPVGEVA